MGNFAVGRTHADLHWRHCAEAFLAITDKITGDIPASAASAYVAGGNATLVNIYKWVNVNNIGVSSFLRDNTYASDSSIVVIVPFVTFAGIPSHRVFATTILTQARKFRTLVDVLTINKTQPSGTQLGKSLCTWSWTRFTSFTPSLSNGRTTTQVLTKQPIQRMHAFSMLVPCKTLFLPYIQTLCPYINLYYPSLNNTTPLRLTRFIQRQSWWTTTRKATFSVNTGATTPANVGV